MAPQPADGPLYRQVAEELRAEIEAQRPGALIATETELERRFSVSRITVRRAIDLLCQAGLLIRRQGSGTYVAAPKVTEELGAIHSWTDGMRAQGLEPRTVHYEALQVTPPPWVAEALRLDPAVTLPRIQRLRYAGDAPLCLMTDYLAPRYVPGLLESGLMGESLYETLANRYSLDLARVEDTVTARAATVLDGSLLGVPTGAPVLAVTRITYLRDEQPLAAATVISRADRYAYQVKGRPGRAPEMNRKKTG
ncbi:MAG TPA: GntR family transcriptional regulator [Chloroflexota bacterium]|nr:GntR family transcriptional regulator [Chloroflexota bacterium]